MSHKTKKIEGFTLIELSVVIVIIGVIIGGVIGGKSLIESAKVQMVINEFTAIEGAFNAYQIKYDAIPGDHDDAQRFFGSGSDVYTACPNGGGGTNKCNGNGDGVIWTSSGFEDTRAFHHLYLAKMVDAGHTTISTSNGGAAWYKSGFNDVANYMLGTGTNGHAATLAQNSSSGGYYTNSAIEPAKAIRIDRKMDDGLGDAGNMLGGRAGRGADAGRKNCYDSGTGKYAIEIDHTSCKLVWTMGE